MPSLPPDTTDNLPLWHELTEFEALHALSADANTGLHEPEAARGLTHYGPNRLTLHGPRGRGD